MSDRESNSTKSSRGSQHGDNSDPSYFVDSKVTRRPIRDNHSFHSESTRHGSATSEYHTASEEFGDEEEFQHLNKAVQQFRHVDQRRHSKLEKEIANKNEIIHTKTEEIYALMQELTQLKNQHDFELHKLQTLAEDNHNFAVQLENAHALYLSKTQDMEREIESYHDDFVEIDETIEQLINEFIHLREDIREKMKAKFSSSSALQNDTERHPPIGIS